MKGAGSSPLTRGKPPPHCRHRGRRRLIPAHAGKTTIFLTTWESSKAHPRSRGENHRSATRSCGVTGSSPLTRGKRPSPRGRAFSARLIPAHAGKTIFARFLQLEAEAHPRSRGENHHFRAVPGRYHGSSPLTRGKRPVCEDERTMTGLIPAHAGKTTLCDAHLINIPAHPRSRGENPTTLTGQILRRGSSPLTRGKRIAKITQRGLCRLIPAHAGKTTTWPGFWLATRAHPRSRGENHASSCQIVRSNGSSPLTRGKLLQTREGRPGCGLIPAHAGKTTGASAGLLVVAAHPRSRGENSASAREDIHVDGSSPLTRGKR